jgi:hypothetical protein
MEYYFSINSLACRRALLCFSLMSSTDEIQDPLSQYSQQEDDEELPQTAPGAENEEALPTSSVYNLSSYDLQEEIPDPETHFCCEMGKSFSLLDKTVFIPDLDSSLGDLREQQRPLITIEDVFI